VHFSTDRASKHPKQHKWRLTRSGINPEQETLFSTAKMASHYCTQQSRAEYRNEEMKLIVTRIVFSHISDINDPKRKLWEATIAADLEVV